MVYLCKDVCCLLLIRVVKIPQLYPIHTCQEFRISARSVRRKMPLCVEESACIACGKPAVITLQYGSQTTLMLERSSANTDELDKPLMRMNLINDLLRVCDKNTTLGEIAENSSNHTSSPQHWWLTAMPAGNTLQWLLDTEITYIQGMPQDASRSRTGGIQ